MSIRMYAAVTGLPVVLDADMHTRSMRLTASNLSLNETPNLNLSWARMSQSDLKLEYVHISVFDIL